MIQETPYWAPQKTVERDPAWTPDPAVKNAIHDLTDEAVLEVRALRIEFPAMRIDEALATVLDREILEKRHGYPDLDLLEPYVARMTKALQKLPHNN